MTIIIRPATSKDIPRIIDELGATFFSESNFAGGLTPDPVQAAGTFGYMIASQSHEILLAENEDQRLIGFLAFDFVRYYTVELVSHMFLFYVHPDFRTASLGRDLLLAAQKVAKEKGAHRFYGSSSAGVDNSGRVDKKMLSLYKRLKFKELGCFVMKEL